MTLPDDGYGEKVPLLFGGVVFTALAVIICWRMCSPPPTQAEPVAAIKELAQEHVEKIEEQSKETRRAARARVDKDVADATRASGLVEYIGSRSAR